MNPAHLQFRNEITNFYLVSLINIVFAALAIAFGVAYMVSAVTGNPPGLPVAPFRILTGAAAMICFGLGLSWLLSTVRIFRGIETIRDILCAPKEPVQDERVTCLIVRMLAHYRDNRETIRTMILVSTAGGCVFFVLFLITSICALTLTGNGGSVTFDAVVLIPAMLLTLGIAVASLVSSYYFSKFSRVWDQRLREIDDSECTLKEKLGLDEP